MKEFLSYVLTVLTLSVFSILAVLTSDMSLPELTSLSSEPAADEASAPPSGTPPGLKPTVSPELRVLMFVCYAWTTYMTLLLGMAEIPELHLEGSAYFKSLWNYLDMVFIFAQGLLSILFWLRDASPGIMLSTAADEISPYVVLTALVLLLAWLRLLFFFRGVLQLGAFVHTLLAIVADIKPIGVCSE